MDGVVIRPAVIVDADAIADLVTQLGYRTTPEQMAGRLEKLVNSADYVTLLAEIPSHGSGASQPEATTHRRYWATTPPASSDSSAPTSDMRWSSTPSTAG